MSSIYLSKVGAIYEGVYYYKQKIVNWEFTSPALYECLISTSVSRTGYTAKNYFTLSKTYEYVNISYTTYITEESYKNNIVYYVLGIYNAVTPSIPLLLIKYGNTSKLTNTFENVNNVTLNTPDVYYPEHIPVTFKQPLTYPIKDTLNCTIFTQFPRGIFQKSFDLIEASMNLIQLLETDKSKLYYTQKLKISLDINRDIINSSVNTTNIYTDRPGTTYSAKNTFLDKILPISTSVCSNELTTVVYNGTSNDLFYIAKNWFFLKSYTYIVT